MAKITKVKLNRKAFLKFRDMLVMRLNQMNKEGASESELIGEVFNMMTSLSDTMED